METLLQLFSELKYSEFITIVFVFVIGFVFGQMRARKTANTSATLEQYKLFKLFLQDLLEQYNLQITLEINVIQNGEFSSSDYERWRQAFVNDAIRYFKTGNISLPFFNDEELLLRQYLARAFDQKFAPIYIESYVTVEE